MWWIEAHDNEGLVAAYGPFDTQEEATSYIPTWKSVFPQADVIVSEKGIE